MINELYAQLVAGVLIVVWGCITVTMIADACGKHMLEQGVPIQRRDGSYIWLHGETWELIAKRWTQIIGLVMIVLGCCLVFQVAYR